LLTEAKQHLGGFMPEEKKSVFLTAVAEAWKKSDLAFARQEKINLRQVEVVKCMQPYFAALIDEIPEALSTYNIRFENCIIFRISMSGEYLTPYWDREAYWEVGVYPYGTSDGTECQLSIHFFPLGVEEHWKAEASNSLEAFNLVSQKLGEIVGQEMSSRNRG
jgi:hypothetical protein